MTFKSVLDIDCGIRFMYEDLELNSSCARKMLLESEMMTSKREIDVYYGKLNELYTKDFKAISLKLMCLKDIHTTIKRLGVCTSASSAVLASTQCKVPFTLRFAFSIPLLVVGS